MKLILHTSIGFTAAILDKEQIIHQIYKPTIKADDIYPLIKKLEIPFTKLKEILYITEPGSQISIKIGAACILPILLIYKNIKYQKISYYNAILYSMHEYIQQDAHIIINNNRKKIYYSHIIKFQQKNYQKILSITNTDFYIKKKSIFLEDALKDINNSKKETLIITNSELPPKYSNCKIKKLPLTALELSGILKYI